MKKNIVIRTAGLRLGGTERVLVEILKNMTKSKYNISLIVTDDLGEGNIFFNDIPKEIDVYFLKSEELINRTEYYKKNKKNFIKRMLHKYYKYLNNKIFVEETLKTVKKIEKKFGTIDTFVDFDYGFLKYVDKINSRNKMVVIHTSIKNFVKKSRIKKFGLNLKKYDKIIAICDDQKKELEALYPYIKEKILRIYNPLDFNRIEILMNNEEELTNKEKDMLKEDYIVSVARLDTKSKDFDTLIKGYKIAFDNGLKEKLYIVGTGDGRPEIENLIKEYKLEKQVILIGKFKNPYVWMKNSRYFVHSSNFEGFGLVLVEAMICGRIVISSNCQVGPKEILENGRCGYLFEVGDYKKLGELLLEISSKLNLNSKEIELKLEYSKQRIEEFNAEKIINEYEKLFDM